MKLSLFCRTVESILRSPPTHILRFSGTPFLPKLRGFLNGKSNWRLLQLGTVALSLLMVALAWLYTWQRLDVEASQAIASATTAQQNLATVMAENLRHVLDRGRLMAQYVGAEPDASLEARALRLADISASDHVFLGQALYDAQGRRLQASPAFRESPELTRAVQELLAAPADAGHQRLLPPPTSEDERAWQIPLLTTTSSRSGHADGVLAVLLDLGYFLRFYRDIELGRTGTVLVLDSAGLVLAEARPEGLMLRPSLQTAPHQVQDSSGSGVIMSDLFHDGRTFLSTFRRPGDAPFIIAISRDREDILATYPKTRARFLWLMGLFSLLLLLISYWVSQNIRRQERNATELARIDREKSELIAELESQKRRAFILAAHDHLTGLPNRRMFNELLASHLQQAKRNRQHYALMFLDLDRFKGINDNLGHHVGDLLLQEVASRLRATLRESDVIARLGGDEFAILLTSLERVEDSAAIADKLVTAISQPCPDLGGHVVKVSPSIGIAAFPRDGANGEALLRNADAAMYRSKQLGRGKYTFYDPALNPLGSRLFDLEQRLPKAIADNELVLHFQPKVRLTDYRITGFEALVRWQHPELGLVYPGEFIPAAENSGLIANLGAWVAEHCCRQLRLWQEQGLDPVPVAYNVSARQLQNEDLPAQLARRLEAHQLPAHLLEIEITETSLVESMEKARQVLGELEQLGVRIALDDFGSGFSGLDYVRSFPIHKIKIDRSFISDIRNRQDDAVIVSSIITMAHNLKLSVIAEGVELLDQLIQLRTSGCDEAQGYFFSRPVPATAATDLLQRVYLIPS